MGIASLAMTGKSEASDDPHAFHPVARLNLVLDHGLVQHIPMRTSVSQAKGQLTELVKLAEVGEEVVLTPFGRDVARLVPLKAMASFAERRAVMERARAFGRKHAKPGPSAARSLDFLHDEETGLPK
jgi:prevent-host-death family protein